MYNFTDKQIYRPLDYPRKNYPQIYFFQPEQINCADCMETSPRGIFFTDKHIHTAEFHPLKNSLIANCNSPNGKFIDCIIGLIYSNKKIKCNLT